jgi:hypothetical protein
VVEREKGEDLGNVLDKKLELKTEVEVQKNQKKYLNFCGPIFLYHEYSLNLVLSTRNKWDLLEKGTKVFLLVY